MKTNKQLSRHNDKIHSQLMHLDHDEKQRSIAARNAKKVKARIKGMHLIRVDDVHGRPTYKYA